MRPADLPSPNFPYVRLFLICFCVLPAILLGQTTLHLPATHLGIDTLRKFALAQLSELPAGDEIDSLSGAVADFAFIGGAVTPAYDTLYTLRSERGDTFTLAFTPLPLIQIRASGPLNPDTKVPAGLTYAYGERTLTSPIGIEYRGAFSLQYPKKNLDLEFRDPADPDESADATFLGMREDDDWILDALYNEPGRYNSYVAHKVWLDLHTLPHAEQEPEAKAGADVAFVEVFQDGEYYGVYTLGEQVDRKQLKLKDVKDGVIRGELYKSEQYSNATRFVGVPGDAPVDDDWAGWEMKHPDVEEGDWDRLRDLIRFVAESSDETFARDAAAKFDLGNTIDFLLFINGLLLIDNVSKNLYLGRYTQDDPYFFVPWDLDAGLGNSYDGSRNPHSSGWMSNPLFQRLRDRLPDAFAAALCDRYGELSKGILHPDSLIARVSETHTLLHESGAYGREADRWPGSVDSTAEQLSFTTRIIRERLNYLDQVACDLPSNTSEAGAVRQSLEVYPVPARQTLYWKTPGNELSVAYRLFDLSGRLVRQGTAGGPIAELSLAGLRPGVYHLRSGARSARVVVVR